MSDPAADLSTQDLLALLRQLLDAWRSEQEATSEFLFEGELATIAMVYGLVNHSYALGSAALLLFDAGKDVEAVPIVRSAFEATIAAAWVAQIADAGRALMNYSRGQQKKLGKTILDAGWAESDQAIPADYLEDFEVSEGSAGSANATIRRCADLAMNHHLYAMYRGLSAFAHPTGHVIDLYLDGLIRYGFVVRQIDVLRTVEATLYILCASLVWSARALDSLDSSAEIANGRERLVAAAGLLRVPNYLEATPEAVQRGRLGGLTTDAFLGTV